MNTSEVLDLSKENIQPLKQGRNAAKLGTALQAQTNSEIHQKLLAEREQFELLIRMYEGEDPLQPHYDYVKWIEQSFPKHGPESNIVQILENTLTTFKDDTCYKQDLRYAELLIKYIDTQPNPLESYQLVYNQGLCTMCASFYKAWAEELDKNNDFKNADQIYELGKRVHAEPIAMLEEAHLRFQLSVGRRMLGRQDESPEETDYNRQALHKLQKKNIHSARDPVGAPGRVKQSLTSHNNQNAPFKVYQGDDVEDYSMYGDSQGKVFPKQKVLNKENTLKPGPWTQNGGKIRTKSQAPTTVIPSFQVHEDEGADAGSRHPKTPSVPGALKTRKKDNFTCPLAVFESPDPTKKPMYCKNKVYAGGREFQFEELRAALYNRRYEQLAALRLQQSVEHEIKHELPADEDDVLLRDNKVANDTKPVIDDLSKEKEDLPPAPLQLQTAPIQLLPFEKHLQSPTNSQEDVKPDLNTESNQEDNLLRRGVDDLNKVEPVFESKLVPLETNTSLFHSQSFTVNTKEAMNVVQEMWNSPSPSPAFGRNLRASVYPPSPVGLDESGLFKVPPVPPPFGKIDGQSTKTPKSIPSFPIFSDDDEPVATPSQPFQIYSDDGESESVKCTSGKDQGSASRPTEAKSDRIGDLPEQLFNPILQPPASHHLPGTDAGILKMLAFQSDSEESSGEEPMSGKNKIERVIPNIPVMEPAVNKSRKSIGAGSFPPLFHEEFEDMTCNTKAFDFVLPSSTPFVGHLKTSNTQQDKNYNGSYIVSEEVKKCDPKQDLSMILEASKERYSSSSGSSGSKTQGSVCTVGSTSIQPPQAELMGKLQQISANKSIELEKSIAKLNISEDADPFSSELITQLLSHIGYPRKHHLIGLHRFDTDAPAVHNNSSVKLGATKYLIVGELGKGSYARVLKATKDCQPVALKQQRPAWEWEWYIVQELQNRLPPNMMDFYLHMTNGYIYKNTSIFESEWAQHGSILSVVNKLKIAGKNSDLHLAMLFSIQMVTIVEHLHKCNIIHGDVKPDNFVLFSLPKADAAEPCLKLIDFGRSIDMTLFPEGTTFTKVVTTDGFQCNEMKEGRPWTYQTDLYGLAGSIYCVLFYDYMKVVKKGNKWQLSQKIPRYMKPAVWDELFTPLLNVESCENLPDLKTLRETLELNYSGTEQAGTQSINKLNNVLMRK